jgi:cytochrome c oxidase assembly factor CtaG
MLAAIPPPTGGPWSWLTLWPIGPQILPIVFAGWLYLAGLRRLRASGRPFPLAWAVWFFSGLAVVFIALASPLDAYADWSFTLHMAQHLLLMLLAPPLLALGAPITLALRASHPQTRRRFLVPLLRSRPVAWLAHPVVGWLLFVGTPVAIHFTPLFDVALRNTTVHAVEHFLWLSSALIYWWPIVGRDPAPHRVGYPARMLSMFLAMPAGSFLALAIYSASSPLYPTYAALPAPWGPNALADQRSAAVMMWLVGNLAMVLAMLIVAVAWKRDEDAAQERIEAREELRPSARGARASP